MMPSEPTAQRSSVPPVNRLYMPSTEAPWAAWVLKNSARTFPFSPGIRMIASSRQMASSMKVNRILDLSSGILKQLLKVLAMAASMGGNQKPGNRNRSETINRNFKPRNKSETSNPAGVTREHKDSASRQSASFNTAG